MIMGYMLCCTQYLHGDSGDNHFAAGAVEDQSEAAPVVYKEERLGHAGCRFSSETRTQPEFPFYAVAASHQLGSFAVGEFVCLFRNGSVIFFVNPGRYGVGTVEFVAFSPAELPFACLS